MILTNVSSPGDRPNTGPIVAMNRLCMLELTFLSHKQGFPARIFQEGVEMVNAIQLKNLDRIYLLLLREELLPSARNPPEVFYNVSYQTAGSLLIQEPQTDCNPSFEGPHGYKP